MFVPWGAKPSDAAAAMPKPTALAREEETIELPAGIEDLTLWTPEEGVPSVNRGGDGEETTTTRGASAIGENGRAPRAIGD